MAGLYLWTLDDCAVLLTQFDNGCHQRDDHKLLEFQIQRKVVVNDGLNLAAENFDFDNGWLSSTIWMSKDGCAVLAQ